MTLTGEDKQKQLHELSSIVSGIRLFNRDCGKGGEGIDDCKFLYSIQYQTFELREPSTLYINCCMSVSRSAQC